MNNRRLISYSFSESSLERDKFMSPTEAKEFGLIDKILDHPPKHGDKPEEVKLETPASTSTSSTITV